MTEHATVSLAPGRDQDPKPVSTSPNPVFGKATVAEMVLFVDPEGATHAAVLTKIMDDGYVNLVEFGIEFGDEAAHVTTRVRYSPVPMHHSWRFREDSRNASVAKELYKDTRG